MLVKQVTSNQTLFPGGGLTNDISSSASFFESLDSIVIASFSNIGSTHIEQKSLSDISSTIFQQYGSDSAIVGTNITFDENFFGSTSYQNATMFSYSIFASASAEFAVTGIISTTSSSSSTSSHGSSQLQYITADPLISTIKSDIITTTHVSTLLSAYTTSGVSPSGELLTTYNQSVNQYLTTTNVTSAFSALSNRDVTGSFNNYIDIGQILSADSEWLWQIHTNDTHYTPRLLSDIGNSANQITVYNNNFTTSKIDFATFSDSIGDASLASQTLLLPGNFTQLFYNYLTTDSTYQDTATSGNSFSRNTIPVTYSHYTTSSSSIGFGNQSASILGLSTQQVTLFTTIPIQTIFTTLYPIGNNQSTTVLQSFSTKWAFITTYSIMPTYRALLDVTFFNGTSQDSFHNSLSIEQSNLAFQNILLVDINVNDGISDLYPAFANGAFINPFDLSDSNATEKTATNLSFPGTQLLYTGLASVFPGVVTPLPYNSSISGNNSHTTKYSWNNQSLTYTDYQTSKTNKYTISNKTVSSGAFLDKPDNHQYYTSNTKGTLGGYNGYTNKDQSITFPPRAVIRTIIDTDGKSSTERSVFSNVINSNIHGKMIIENLTPAYILYTYLDITFNGQNPYLTFPLNND